jgi:Flp pilus assembly protein TadG
MSQILLIRLIASLLVLVDFAVIVYRRGAHATLRQPAFGIGPAAGDWTRTHAAIATRNSTVTFRRPLKEDTEATTPQNSSPTIHSLNRRSRSQNAFRVLRNEEGQAMVMVALCLTSLVGVVGFAIDVGHCRYVQNNLQTVADAAALAGAAEVRICGGTKNCSVMQTAAEQAVIENGYAVTTFNTECSGSTGATGLTLMVNNPTCALSGDPNSGATKLNYVETVVTDQVPTYFGRVIGINTVQVTARAEAERGVGGPCIYALDPTGADAILLVAGVLVDVKCDIVDESNNAAALDCLVGLGIYAPRINVTGGAEGLLDGLLCGSTPAPKLGIPPPNPADPLAYLPEPTTANGSSSCGTTTSSPYTGSPHQVSILLGLLSTTTFNPGIYCGGINITAAVLSNVTFNPGTYILRQGAGGLLDLGTTGGLTITISALSSITGNGVTFYSETGSQPLVNGFSVTAPATLGLSSFNLSAPTSGEYGGVLFWEQSTNTAQSSFLLSLLNGSSVNGAIYVPDATVFYGVNALSTNYNILVAKDITFTAAVASAFGNNYATLESGSPLNGDNVMLVQ